MQALKRLNLLLLAVMMMFVIVACATTGTQKPMTAKQQASVWMLVYNSTYDDTMAVMKSPTSTVAQKDMAQKKKVILTQVWPLLKVYVAIVEGGGTPSVQDTAAIADLINQLAAVAGGA